jgi:hypothetical protein
MLAWPVESPAGLVRYPFSPETFRAFQTWFFVHHIGLVVGAVGFALSGATGPGRFGRIAAWLAVIGMVGLTGMELFAIQFGEWDNKVASTGTMGAGYGITTNLVGLGMLGESERASLEDLVRLAALHAVVDRHRAFRVRHTGRLFEWLGDCETRHRDVDATPRRARLGSPGRNAAWSRSSNGVRPKRGHAADTALLLASTLFGTFFNS